MTAQVQQAKITALMPDFQQDRLALGAVREWINALAHLPDDVNVAWKHGVETSPWRRPMSGGILEVVEYDGMPGSQP